MKGGKLEFQTGDRWFLRRRGILQEIQGSVGFWCGKTWQFEPETARKFFPDSKIWNLQAKFPFLVPRMDRSLHWLRRIWTSNWIFGAEKSFPEVWKCGILHLLWKELSNGVGIIQIGRKLPDSDFQQNPVASPTKWKHRKTPVPLGNHEKWKFQQFSTADQSRPWVMIGMYNSIKLFYV